jgi:hypothetical protein
VQYFPELDVPLKTKAKESKNQKMGAYSILGILHVQSKLYQFQTTAHCTK